MQMTLKLIIEKSDPRLFHLYCSSDILLLKTSILCCGHLGKVIIYMGYNSNLKTNGSHGA